MGNRCNSCIGRPATSDEAEDALLGDENGQQPRGPPPPYQIHPFYMLTEQQRLHIVSRLTLIQSLPVGRYELKKGYIKATPSDIDATPSHKSSTEKLTPDSDDEATPKKGATPEKGATPLCKMTPNKIEGRECPICMNEFTQGEVIRLLPCMHYYHTRCIDSWLMRALTCPNCMQRVDQPLPTHTRSHSVSSIVNMATPVTNNNGDSCSSSTELPSSPSPPSPPSPSSPSHSPHCVVVDVHY